VTEKRLAGNVGLVTGANSGIGKATTLELAGKGTPMLLACRDPQEHASRCLPQLDVVGKYVTER
jgi:NAD(P)-dependent dehydrogenase (short-subunit alcohol dehydrogenase family)